MKSLPTFLALLLSTTLVLADGKDFHDQDLTNKKFTGEALNGADFSDAVLSNTDFSKASLKRAIFRGAVFKYVYGGDADFSGADFRETNFTGQFNGADFSKANFEGITAKSEFGFYNAKFRGANFKNSKGWKGDFYNCDMTGADLRGANFRGAKFSGDTILRNALYDDDTSWPNDFDPKAAGAKLSDKEAGDDKKDK